MSSLKSIIIEGCDRLGKSTLIDGIKQRLGFFQTIHYQKPELLDCYLKEARRELGRPDEASDQAVISHALRSYQRKSFTEMFHLLSGSTPLILDRAHLGEFVYAPRYRNYDGAYVFDLERSLIEKRSNFHETTLLVLLHTSSFDFVEDDGQSFDFNKKEEEQNDFIRAFEKSEIVHKLLIDVNDGTGSRIPKDRLIDVVCKTFGEITMMQYPILNVHWNRQGDDLIRFNYLQPDPKKLVS